MTNCPNCKSPDVDNWETRMTNDGVDVDFTCNECEFQFTIKFVDPTPPTTRIRQTRPTSTGMPREDEV